MIFNLSKFLTEFCDLIQFNPIQFNPIQSKRLDFCKTRLGDSSWLTIGLLSYEVGFI